MAAVFLTVVNADQAKPEIEEKITRMLEKRLRESDVAFQLKKPFTWCVFLSQSGATEATPFLHTLFEEAKNELDLQSIGLTACVFEIRNRHVSFEDLLSEGEKGIASAIDGGAWYIEVLSSFHDKEVEEVKVSILEPDEVVCRVMQQSLDRLSFDTFDLHIRSFGDGYEFLQSDWYSSSHFHLIILNDILPRKNGLDVLHTIRKLPNNRKFYIFLMTKSKSEDAIIYSLESGADDYIEKPFNIRLFEAKVRRVLNRLWQ